MDFANTAVQYFILVAISCEKKVYSPADSLNRSYISGFQACTLPLELSSSKDCWVGLLIATRFTKLDNSISWYFPLLRTYSVDPKWKEFSLGIAAVSDSSGVAAAGFTGIFLEPLLRKYSCRYS